MSVDPHSHFRTITMQKSDDDACVRMRRDEKEKDEQHVWNHLKHVVVCCHLDGSQLLHYIGFQRNMQIRAHVLATALADPGGVASLRVTDCVTQLLAEGDMMPPSAAIAAESHVEGCPSLSVSAMLPCMRGISNPGIHCISTQHVPEQHRPLDTTLGGS